MNLHLDEHHNPLREELAAKGAKTYACFVEGCERKCSSPQKRRLHLIDKHSFPKDYNFRITQRGLNKSTSLLTGRWPKHSVTSKAPSQYQAEPLSVTADTADTTCMAPSQRKIQAKGIEDSSIGKLEESLAALSFVPPSVQAAARRMKKPG